MGDDGVSGKLTIGAPREVFAGEARVAMTPDSALQLHKLGYGCAIEAGAGTRAGFSGDAYRAAGGAVLPDAAALLPPAASFDVVGYACTSGTTLIGADHVTQLVSGACQTRAVANPLSAALGALSHLRVGSVAIVSPYTPRVAQPIQQAFEQAGLRVPQTLSFGEEIVARGARAKIETGSNHS